MEVVFKARQRGFGKVPEAIFLCCIKDGGISTRRVAGKISMEGENDEPIAYCALSWLDSPLV